MHTATTPAATDYTIVHPADEGFGNIQIVRFWSGGTANHWATIVGYRFTTEDGLSEPGGLTLEFGQRNAETPAQRMNRVSTAITPDEMHELADVISEGRARLAELKAAFPASMQDIEPRR